MYKAAIDVYYKEDVAKAAAIIFNDWQDLQPFKVYRKWLSEIKEYEPGAFYKRELPCILAVLEEMDLSELEVIIIDGYVYLDDQNRAGLGMHLYRYLEEKIPVIGVAKTRFFGLTANVAEVMREGSQRPLFVTAAGIPVDTAASHIKTMAGDHRIPDLLKLLDRITKQERE